MKVTFFALSLLVASVASAQQPANPDGRFEQRLTRRLSLNATQQNLVHTALAEKRVELQGIGQQMRSLQTQMNAAIMADNQDQINQISQQMAPLQQQQTAVNATCTAKIYASLAADQKTKIGNRLGMLMGRGPGFGPWRGRGAAPPPATTPQQ